jgi:hypothetical protein
METLNMKKILLPAALALVAGAPLAFAAGYPANTPAALTTLHCTRVNQYLAYNQQRYATESDYRTAQQNAYQFCREDRHKNFDRTGGNVFR